jgi:DUF1365 family protein
MTSAPAVYRTSIAHARTAPVDNRFRYASHSWLVDLARVPRLPPGLRWLARFDVADHLGDPAGSLLGNVQAFLAGHGIDLRGGRVLMLANPRSLGHVANPISIHWCFAADGSLAALVAEVHNTYGDRHSYVVRPETDGSVSAGVDKAMYVSPFNPIDGTYRITAALPGTDLSVTVRLDRAGQPPFVATMRGRRLRWRGLLAMAVTTATTSWQVDTLIRWQGIRLALRGVRIEPRPSHPPQESAP